MDGNVVADSAGVCGKKIVVIASVVFACSDWQKQHSAKTQKKHQVECVKGQPVSEPMIISQTDSKRGFENSLHVSETTSPRDVSRQQRKDKENSKVRQTSRFPTLWGMLHSSS